MTGAWIVGRCSHFSQFLLSRGSDKKKPPTRHSYVALRQRMGLKFASSGAPVNRPSFGRRSQKLCDAPGCRISDRLHGRRQH